MLPHGAPHILVVDDDARLRALLQKFLMRSGFGVSLARDGAQAQKLWEALVFDLIVLDVMMPGADGIALTRALRTKAQTPILLLTAKDGVESRIEGLEAGADDYLAKPFEPRELLLRISAILRRARIDDAPPPESLHMGPVRYDTKRGELWRGEALVHLTAGEAFLMRVLAARPGQVVGRDELLGEHGRADESGSERAVDVQITRLRRKIEDNPKQPRYLQTVRGEGYRLQPD